nr:hypothetical transcript [Hymenolepis microstoma]
MSIEDDLDVSEVKLSGILEYAEALNVKFPVERTQVRSILFKKVWLIFIVRFVMKLKCTPRREYMIITP